MSFAIFTPARSILAVLLSSLLLIGVVVTAPPADAAGFAQKKERRMLNKERRPRKKPVLKMNWKLNKIARNHSQRMARRNRLYHNPKLGRQISHRMRRWRIAAENVGVGHAYPTMRKSINVLHDAFMKSRPHRKNILRPRMRKVGIGVVRARGRVWVTVVFVG